MRVHKDPFLVLNSIINVSHETFERLEIYYSLLLKWQSKINLVSKSSLEDAWTRHIADSAQIQNHFPSTYNDIMDMGSGAGFPGLVLAILGAKDVHLVESDGKKISFMEEVAMSTKTDVTIHHCRISDVRLKKVSIITARALSDLNQLFEDAIPHVSHETICLFHKGKNYSKEIDDASVNWKFDCTVIPSVTDEEGVILKISNLWRGHDEGTGDSEPKRRGR